MGTERLGFSRDAAPKVTELARTGGEVERARPEEVDNAIAAGVNALLMEMPKLVRRGEVDRLRDVGEKIAAGVQLAEAHGMTLEPRECVVHIQREVACSVPEGIKALAEKGKAAVMYGQPKLARHYREQLLALLGNDAKDGGSGESALVSNEESLADFKRSVREGLFKAPDGYLDDVLRKLELGIVDAAGLMLKQVDELEEISREFGVPFDRADFERSFDNILRKTALIAIDKAILDIRNKVRFGALDIVDFFEGNILKYLNLLTDRGVARPISNEDLRERVQEQKNAGLKDGIDEIIGSIGRVIRLGFPGSAALYLKKLDAYLASAAKAGVGLKPASKYAEEVEVVIRTEIVDGAQKIVDVLEADLRRGRFRKNMVNEAHERVDQAVALAKKVGVKMKADDFHKKIDDIVRSINPAA